MKVGVALGVLGAIVLHAGFILFGGALLAAQKKDHGTLQEVDLLSQDDAQDEGPEESEAERARELDAETEAVPDAEEIVQSLEEPASLDAPALDAASLSAIEAALEGHAGGDGDFASSLSFASGGRIGGTGTAGRLDDDLENAFTLAEIDQKPRAIFQTSPVYPSSMRGKKVEAVVTVLFVVDDSGKVMQARVEQSTHAAFDTCALDAVKKWKFEPGIKAGRRVACKLRVPIRFPASGS